jgi:hypothetical protein
LPSNCFNSSSVSSISVELEELDTGADETELEATELEAGADETELDGSAEATELDVIC